MLMLTAVRANPFVLQSELQNHEQLRKRIIDALRSGLQGPRQRHLLWVKLSELNRSIASIQADLGTARMPH
jgi:hypothetical protein